MVGQVMACLGEAIGLIGDDNPDAVQKIRDAMDKLEGMSYEDDNKTKAIYLMSRLLFSDDRVQKSELAQIDKLLGIIS